MKTMEFLTEACDFKHSQADKLAFRASDPWERSLVPALWCSLVRPLREMLAPKLSVV
jgi:hypothetical protein